MKGSNADFGGELFSIPFGFGCMGVLVAFKERNRVAVFTVGELMFLRYS